MKVLILGGAGFIGVHLARRLKEAGHAVTIVDDFSRGRDDPELAALEVPVLHADLTDPGPSGPVTGMRTRFTCSPRWSGWGSWRTTRRG